MISLELEVQPERVSCSVVLIAFAIARLTGHLLKPLRSFAAVAG
ncbi:hypothetical protein [Pseudanabaena sp. FACHB-2040]|nr:hypothetical protein [Pseudanabaena sp. FACHB-2040]